MPDPVTRSAARVAALVAVPAALLAGVGAFLVIGGGGDDPEPVATPPPATSAAVPSRPVEMAAPELAEAARTTCRALLARLPDDLRGLAQRPVTAGEEQNAAYGEPPVTLACGGPDPEYHPTDEVYEVVLPPPVDAGICWHLDQEADASVWTTMDRQVPVRIRVPEGYDGPGQLVTALSGPVAEAIPASGSGPSGCR